MNNVRITWVALAALFVLTPCANAQQATTTVSEVLKLQPGTFSHPGTSADVLGIRVGMTVSQADAIAEKIYGKPEDVDRDQDTFVYRDVSVQSHPYVLYETYDKSLGHGGYNGRGDDNLNLYFLSPVSSNRLFAISRRIIFNGFQGDDPKKALADPSISALEASLVKKYGQPSFESKHYGYYANLVWAFTQKSRISGITARDFGDSYADNVIEIIQKSTNLSDIADGQMSAYAACTTSNRHPSFSFLIRATIQVNDHDHTKADSLTVALLDPPACLNDVNESITQLKSDAIKAYKSALSKAPTAPKL